MHPIMHDWQLINVLRKVEVVLLLAITCPTSTTETSITIWS